MAVSFVPNTPDFPKAKLSWIQPPGSPPTVSRSPPLNQRPTGFRVPSGINPRRPTNGRLVKWSSTFG